MDILPSLPVDAASLNVLWRISRPLINMKGFPYMQQLKDLEKSFSATVEGSGEIFLSPCTERL